MRRLLVTILIVGAFLGGYYLGHQEGSPDIFGWAQKAYPQFAEASRGAVASLASTTGEQAAEDPRATGGEADVYRAAEVTVQKQLPARPEWSPGLWLSRRNPEPRR
jgi:hypothetical protein